MSFQAPVEAIVLSAFSVRFVPPTASTEAELAGQETWAFLSSDVSWLAGTPRAQAEEPVSPAATTVVIPSAAVAASCRSAIVRDAVYEETVASQTP